MYICKYIPLIYICICVYIYIYIHILNLKSPLKLIANLHIVNFLDIALDLRNSTYDNHPVYINKNSVLRELPKSISKRLSDLSSNKDIFQKATPIYFEALEKSGFNEPLVLYQRLIPAITPVKSKGSTK